MPALRAARACVPKRIRGRGPRPRSRPPSWDRRPQRLDRLPDVAARRARPLHRALDQRSGVLRAELGRDEERVERLVADEDEPPARMRGEVAAAVAGERGGRAEAAAPAKRRPPRSPRGGESPRGRSRRLVLQEDPADDAVRARHRREGILEPRSRHALRDDRREIDQACAEQLDDPAPDGGRVAHAADQRQVAQDEAVGGEGQRRGPRRRSRAATTRPPGAAEPRGELDRGGRARGLDDQVELALRAARLARDVDASAAPSGRASSSSSSRTP